MLWIRPFNIQSNPLEIHLSTKKDLLNLIKELHLLDVACNLFISSDCICSELSV
jgi:hypothetical protein